MNLQCRKELEQVINDHRIYAPAADLIGKFEQCLVWAESVWNSIPSKELFERILKSQIGVPLAQNSRVSFAATSFVLGATHKKHRLSDNDFKNINESAIYALFGSKMLFSSFTETAEYLEIVKLNQKLINLGNKSVA